MSGMDLMEESFQERKKIFFTSSEDRISKLPESLISQILLYLPTKEAVATSTLSKAWKSLWRLTPGLDLDSSEFPHHSAFVVFMYRFLAFSREHKSCLHKVKLSICRDENDLACLTRWVDFVAKSKVEHLDVECFCVRRERLEGMPLSLYICETLVYLRLRGVVLGKFESVSLPRLKTLTLELNVYASEESVETLISSCPVLEDLSIVRRVGESVKVIRVLSQTLTRLRIVFYVDGEDDEAEGEVEVEDEKSEALIDAPKLKSLSFPYDLPESITIRNLACLTKVHLFGEDESDAELDLQKQRMVRTFFNCISDITDMKINWTTFEYLQNIRPLLPKFVNLCTLQVGIYLETLESLPTFLESLPNLKFLILKLLDCFEMEDITRPSSVPMCLLSSLEFIEIKSKYCKVPTLVASYFLENSQTLKKLVLRFNPEEEDSIVLRDEILALPKRSTICQIEFVDR